MSDIRLFTTRREFLTGGLSLLSAAPTLPLFLGGAVRALAGPEGREAANAGRILVVVQLAGGNDGLNTVIPYEMDEYYAARPRLAVPRKQVVALEKSVGLHSAAAPLGELFKSGQMAIIQGVGYPNPNRSHFASMDIWHTADPTERQRNGWLGRYFDACCNGSDPGCDGLEAIALMRETPLALQGERFQPLAFENADALRWTGDTRDPEAARVFELLNNAHGDLPPAKAGEPPLAEYLQRAALKALAGAEDIQSAAGNRRRWRTPLIDRVGQLGRSLQIVARMIASDLPTRVYYISMGGFDTHTNQTARHQQLLTEFAAAMKNFLATLERDMLLDRVLVLTFSEFGRRVEENAGGGTDHGEAAPMFLFGSRVIPGIHGEHPSLSKLHRGDLAFSTDFRRVYAGVLRDWLRIKPGDILPGGQNPLKLVRTG